MNVASSVHYPASKHVMMYEWLVHVCTDTTSPYNQLQHLGVSINEDVGHCTDVA